METQTFQESDKEKFLKWAKGTVYDMGKNICRSRNNWGAWGIQAMMAYAILNEDEEDFYRIVALWKKHLSGNLNKDGAYRHELKRHDGPKGQGISYSQFAQHAYALTAEMCLNHGVDLFKWKTADGAGLKDGAVNIFNWEMKPDSFPYNKKYKQGTGAFYGGWEILYRQYKVSKWKRKLAELRKPPHKHPFRSNEGPGWLTLTHGAPIR